MIWIVLIAILVLILVNISFVLTNIHWIFVTLFAIVTLFAFSKKARAERKKAKKDIEEYEIEEKKIKELIKDKKKEEKQYIDQLRSESKEEKELFNLYFHDDDFVNNVKVDHMLKSDLIVYCATIMDYDISSFLDSLSVSKIIIDYADIARVFSTMKECEEKYNITYTKTDIDSIMDTIKRSVSTIESKVSEENKNKKKAKKEYHNVTEAALSALDKITGRYAPQSAQISNVYNENYACTSVLASGRYPALRFAIGNGLYVDKENTTVSIADLRDVFSQKVFMDAFENNLPERPFVVMADVFIHMLRVGEFPERSLVRCVNKDSLDIYHMLKNQDLTVDEVQNLTHTWERNPVNQI